MPGNEVGDRVHNFLGQESVQQGQHNSPVVDEAWPGLSSNLWVGSQRQVGGSLVSNFKNYSTQQLALAETERGHVAQSSSLQHGLNFMQSSLRPEISRTQSQNQSAVANGYVQGHQAFHTRQNEANFLGMDTASRGISVLDSHIANSSELLKKNSLRLESAESPVNYDFFRSLQSMGVQHPAMLQSLQQPGVADIQFLQQHAMLKQMQEFQRQQLKPEFQQQEAIRFSSANQVSSISGHESANLSQVPINGIPIHDASNHSWQPEFMTANTNWMQHAASSAMQVSSNGLVSPDPGQVRLMGFVPQQVDQSLYGVPVNSSRGNHYSSVDNDRPLMQPIATSNSFVSSNQYAMFTDQICLPEGNSASQQSEHGKNMFGSATGQGLNSGANLENLRQVNTQSRNSLMQELYGKQGLAGPPEISQEKSVVKASPSQNVVTLDPTEEKILFGSDDGVWDIFGRGSNMGAMLDGADSLGAFPSVQSGSWSALMQSAVAETSSSDVGLQEQWSGLGLENGEPQTRNPQLSVAGDGYRKQSTWVVNSLPTSSKTIPSYNETNMNLGRGNVAGIQQTESLTSHEQNLRQHDDPAKRDVERTPERRINLLYSSALQKSGGVNSQHFEKASHSPDVQLDARSFSGQPQSMAFCSGSQLNKDANGWNFIEPASHGRNAVLNAHASESSSQFSGVVNDRNQMQQMNHVSGFWKPGSLPDASVALGNYKSGAERPRVSKEGSTLNNDAAVMDSMSVRATKEGSQELQKSCNLDIWRNTDFSKSSGPSNTLEKEKQSHDMVPRMVDSLANNHPGKVTDESYIKENSNDSLRPNVSRHVTGVVRENELLDGTEPGGAKHKASGHVTQKPSVIRKFQYHPMGDIDVDVGASYKAKHAMHSQSTQQHVSQGLEGHDQRHFGQSKFHGGFGGSKQIDKGSLLGFQGDLKCSEQLSSKNMNPGYVSAVSAPVSQNMLELLQKVDQSSEPGHAMQFNSTGQSKLQEMCDAETSDGSVCHRQQNQPSVSQGFNLQLAPPSENFPISYHLESQSLSQPTNSLNLKRADSEMAKKGHALFGEFRNNNKGLQQSTEDDFSNTFSSQSSYLGINIQEQCAISPSGQVIQSESSATPGRPASDLKQSNGSCEIAQSNQPRKLSAPHFSGASDNDHNSVETSQLDIVKQNHVGVARKHFPVLEAMTASQPSIAPVRSQQVAFSKMLPGTWTNTSSPQQFSGALPPTDSQNILKPPFQSKADDLNAQTRGEVSTITGAFSEKAQGTVRDVQPATVNQVSPEKDVGHSTVNGPHLQCSDLDQATTQRDIEAFGRSLRPNNSINQNYSLLHQVQAMRNIETDQNNRSMKRFKGADIGLDAQHEALQGGHQSSFGSDTIVRDALPSQTSASSGDSKMLLSSPNCNDNTDSHLSSKEKSPFVGNNSHNYSNNNLATAISGERPQISPQMAPCWFDQCGTFKNGQMFPLENSQKTSNLKTVEKLSMVAKPADRLKALNSAEHVNASGDTAKLGDVQQSSTPLCIASEQISSPHFGSGITDHNLVLRQKKRKSAMSELLPWHKEVTLGLQRLHTISVAEVDWAHATNRLTEKVEDQADCAEDRQPVLRSKQRIVLTTQLMQQLFQAPSRFLFANGSEQCESVAYFTARLALGDASSTVSACEKDNPKPPESGNTSSEKIKSPERIGDQYISKAVEDFISRTKMLESELLRLDKRASTLDVRLECQDLEKFSVINRFAKFHGRGQGDGNGTETPSSSDTGVGGQKSVPQRYVTALPLPRNLPDRVQCLSL